MARVGIDLDGVLYDFIGDLARYVSVTTGRPLSELGPAVSWDFYADTWGYTKREYHRFVTDAVANKAIFMDLGPLPGSKQAIRRLRKLGHTVHIITARGFGPNARPLTCWWLDAYQIPHDSLTFAVDKRVIDVDFMLDDKPANVDDMREVGCAAYLLDCGRSDQVGHPYLVKDWAEFLAIVEASTSD